MSIEEPVHAPKKVKLILKKSNKPTNAKRVKKNAKMGEKIIKNFSKNVNSKSLPKTLQQKQ